MVTSTIRFPAVRRAAITALVLSLLLSLVLIGYGLGIATSLIRLEEHATLATSIWPIATGVLLLIWATSLWCLIDLNGKIESTNYRSHDALLDIKASLEEQTRFLRDTADNTQLSDAARSIAHREREQNVLRQAINEDILREDWEAAYYLVEQLERRFGYKLEADQLRSEIDTSRSTLIGRKVEEAMEQVKNLMAAHDWERARRGMDHLVKRYSEHPGVKALPTEFETRRSEHKRRLLKEWDQAVQRDEVDRGIRILKELDQYLTPNEAQALKEAARDVFRARLHQLGVQFSLAVTDGQWTRAMDIGKQIMNEFPNSRMASEVRERYKVLQQRADRTAVAGAANA